MRRISALIVRSPVSDGRSAAASAKFIKLQMLIRSLRVSQSIRLNYGFEIALQNQALLLPRWRRTSRFSSSLAQESPSPDLVNYISRLLSDHRKPHHDLESSLNGLSSKISSDVVEQVLKRCKNLGFSAHRFFLWAKRIPGFQHSPESFHILVDILGGSKQFALLWDFLIEVRDSGYFWVDSKAFWLIFRAYSKAKLPADAVRAFNRMAEFGINPTIDDLDSLLYNLCKGKHVKAAQDFFDRIKQELRPTTKSYTIMIRGWGDIGASTEARKLFDEMLERKYPADVPSYNSMLEALCKGGNVEEAYRMFEELRGSGIELDASTFSIFIRAYCDAKDIHAAVRVLDRMSRLNLTPNLYTYNCIIKKLCSNDMVDEAYQLMNQMVERGISPDTWSYNSILAYHCEHTEVNRALKLISIMGRAQCSPDRHTYNMVLKMLIRIGRFDRVKELWENMAESGFCPSVSTYAVMIHGYSKKRGKLEEAIKYLEMMIDEGLPPYTTTVEMLRNKLTGLGMVDAIDILAGKMARSTSCSIQELAKDMKGGVGSGRLRREETDFESE